jgi:hypothetical protein
MSTVIFRMIHFLQKTICRGLFFLCSVNLVNNSEEIVCFIDHGGTVEVPQDIIE